MLESKCHLCGRPITGYKHLCSGCSKAIENHRKQSASPAKNYITQLEASNLTLRREATELLNKIDHLESLLDVR